MATAKRLYLYGVSLAGLVIAVAGAIMVLEILLNNMHVGVQYTKASDLKGTNIDRMIFAEGLGLLVAGLITWLFHWSIVERLVRAQTDAAAAAAAAAERRSIVRAVYFLVVLSASLWIAVVEWIGLVAHSVADRVQGPAVSTTGASVPFSDLAGGIASSAGLQTTGDSWNLAIAVAATATFVYHVWLRDRDLRTTDLISGAAAWVSRFYLYGAAFIALVVALNNISTIINVLAVQFAAAKATFSYDALSFGNGVQLGGRKAPVGADWVRPVTYAVTAGLAWGAVWFGHWTYSLRLRAAGTPQGEAERTSKVRLAFLAVVVLWAVHLVLDHISFGLGQLLAALTDVKTSVPTWYLVAVLPLMAVPAGVAWWWHRQVALDEEPSGPAGLSATRILLYVTAIVGIAMLADGAVRAIETAITQVFSKADPSAWKAPLSFGIGALVVGAVTWYLFWRLAEARLLTNRATDTTSSSRTYYLYAILGISVVAFTQGLAVLIHRYSQAVTGPKQTDLAVGAAPAFAAVLVFGALIVYHTWIYRRDSRTPEGAALLLPTTGPATIVAAPKGRGGAKAAAAAKPAAKSTAKPAAKSGAKASAKPGAKGSAKPAAKSGAKPAAKPAAERTTTPEPEPWP